MLGTLVNAGAIVIGTILGELIDLDDKINRLGQFLERKFAGKKATEENNEGSQEPSALGRKVSLAEGFVTSSLLFCVGAMAIVGSLQSGLTGNHETLFAKSMLDFVAAIIFASTLGAGDLFADFTVSIIRLIPRKWAKIGHMYYLQ